jgi:GNAT superfamily N-acetyltransferase
VSAQPLSAPVPLAEAGQIDCDSFACGVPSLDDWLKRRASEAEKGTARTYLVLAGTRVAAFDCLSAGGVDRSAWPGRYRRNAPDPIPVIVLGRLAVDSRFKERGLSRDLMRHAMRQTLAASGIIGARALIVHPLDEAATAFYSRLGFLPLTHEPAALFLPIETIAAAFTAAPPAPG